MGKIILVKVVEETVVDGPGFRTTVYGAGCSHACKGCHNPQTWSLSSGHAVDVHDLAQQLMEDPFVNITFSGGDPLFQVEAFTELAKLIKMGSSKNIWCYTGYTFENILLSEKLSIILPYIDVLVDGPFIEEQKSIEVKFRGSLNQRLIDVQQSLSLGEVVLWNDKIGL